LACLDPNADSQSKTLVTVEKEAQTLIRINFGSLMKVKYSFKRKLFNTFEFVHRCVCGLLCTLEKTGGKTLGYIHHSLNLRVLRKHWRKLTILEPKCPLNHGS